LVAPSGGTPPRSGVGHPLERGPVSIESRAPPRASLRLARGHHGPATSIPAPPAGVFNALTIRRRPGQRRIHATTRLGIAPRHYAANSPGDAIPAIVQRCAAWPSNNPVALCHPLPYGRRVAPSKKDGGALEGKTNNYATLVQGQRRDVGPAGLVTSVAIDPVRPSPPSPTPSRPLHHHP
jgi:hypothetical protein